MTEREAWLFIAGSFKDKSPDDEHSVHELPNGIKVDSFGMCHLINTMRTYRVITESVWNGLRDKIHEALRKAGDPSFLYDCSLEGNNQRADFCTRHAEQLAEGS